MEVFQMKLRIRICFLVFFKVSSVINLSIDEVDCGVDHSPDVLIGDVEAETYPWLGVLYYTDDMMNDVRSVVPVALIQAEFVVASAAEIGDIPKRHFRRNSRVLMGQKWHGTPRRVADYVMHPQYGETLNTVALIHLRAPIRDGIIKPLCPPPEMMTDPEFFVVRFKEDYENLQKEVMAMYYVPARLCRDFYVAANLYAERMRPPHVVCACAVEDEKVCVWEAGSALVTRDVWGRWQLLGLGVRGPGCAGPSRYLDMLSYYPWIRESIQRFARITISKLNPHKYVLRSSGSGNTNVRSFGACDDEEKQNILYRDHIRLRTDNMQYQFLTYNLTILETLEITCLRMELRNASSTSEMKVRHFCGRKSFGPACYQFDRSVLDISVLVTFSDSCMLIIEISGIHKNLTIIDILDWKWEEGTYYADFDLTRSEYRGQSFMTGYGFEPLDPNMWVPNYDYWSTTEFNDTTSRTTVPPAKNADEEEASSSPWWSVSGIAKQLGILKKK